MNGLRLASVALVLLAVFPAQTRAETAAQPWRVFDDDVFRFSYPPGWEVTTAPAQAPSWQRLWRVARADVKSTVPMGALIIAESLDGKEKRPLAQIYQEIKWRPGAQAVGHPTFGRPGQGECMTFLSAEKATKGCGGRARTCFELDYNMECYGPSGHHFVFFVGLGLSSRPGVIDDRFTEANVDVMKRLCDSLEFKPRASAADLARAWHPAGEEAYVAFMMGDYPRALSQARTRARAGDLMGQFILGVLYSAGTGVLKDQARAEASFRKALVKAGPAAEGGDARAQFVLGRMYRQGWVVPKDDAQAAVWLRRSAAQGYAPGQEDLAILFRDGQGVAQHHGEALAWSRKAAEQGYAPGLTSVGMFYANGWGVAQDYAEAVPWFRKAAAQGFANGQFCLATMYALGNGVPQDYKQALLWYRKAADQGDVGAQTSLGSMYATGKGVAQDAKQAAFWYRKAADQGDAFAKEKLGEIEGRR